MDRGFINASIVNFSIYIRAFYALSNRNDKKKSSLYYIEPISIGKYTKLSYTITDFINIYIYVSSLSLNSSNKT